MTAHEEEYQELRSLGPHDRRSWLLNHAPTSNRGHWWLALIEHAQFDASPRRSLSPDRERANLELAVELIEDAQDDGMPPYYAASRLALLASAILKSDRELADVPDAIQPDNLAKRILDTFRLSADQAVLVASRLRGAGRDEPATAESDALREIDWLLPDLGMLSGHITDAATKVAVSQWLAVSSGLST